MKSQWKSTDFNTVQKNKLAVFFKTDNSIQNHQQSAILKKKTVSLETKISSRMNFKCVIKTFKNVLCVSCCSDVWDLHWSKTTWSFLIEKKQLSV